MSRRRRCARLLEFLNTRRQPTQEYGGGGRVPRGQRGCTSRYGAARTVTGVWPSSGVLWPSGGIPPPGARRNAQPRHIECPRVQKKHPAFWPVNPPGGQKIIKLWIPSKCQERCGRNQNLQPEIIFPLYRFVNFSYVFEEVKSGKKSHILGPGLCPLP